MIIEDKSMQKNNTHPSTISHAGMICLNPIIVKIPDIESGEAEPNHQQAQNSSRPFKPIGCWTPTFNLPWINI